MRLVGDWDVRAKPRHHAALSAPRRGAARSLAPAHATEKLQQRKSGRRADVFRERPAARPAQSYRSPRKRSPTRKMNLHGTRAECCRRKSAPSDALEADDRAIVNIPTFRTVRVAVFASSASPFAADLLSVLSSNPYVQAQILPPGTQRKHFSRRRDLSRRELAGAAGLQFDLVSQRPAGCRIRGRCASRNGTRSIR